MDSRSTKGALLCLLAGLMAGCGGGGDDAAAPATNPVPSAAAVQGKFVDSPVANLGYGCGAGADATSGVTDSLGQFDFVPAATGTAAPLCTFKIGDIVLGTASAATMVTPFDLVPGASPDDVPLNARAVNIARFLQSIDSDGNGSNGISIPAETNAALAGKTLDFSAANFDVLAAALLPAGKTLVSAANAGDALKTTLLGLYGGSYSCTYSGIVSGVDRVLGTVSVTITFDTLTGTGVPTFPSTGTPFDVDGTLSPSGVSNTSTSTGATFAGSFESVDGSAATTSGNGTWSDPGLGSGTWACKHD
jgi:hypothetical protein